ncbi:MAG: hypothetical protein WC683_01720 [bacterium]
MSWYYYSGSVPTGIPVSRTKSVAVAPHTKVEIVDMTPAAQALLRRGVLRRTGRPAGAPLRTNVAVTDQKVADVVPKSALARYFAEKGVTKSKEMPPKKPVGKPEFTEHELAVVAGEAAAAPVAHGSDAPVEEAGAEAVDHKDGERRGSKRRRHF